ncbi:MAG: hypothetical protein JXM79_12400 [Sedimentisphaerales bacterium]|nr:hypothetical protein [Sedimentisphaerales bacterium]
MAKSVIRGNYPTDTTFGIRFRDLFNEKSKVAQKVISKFLGQGSSAFIGDGSSTFFVGLHIIKQKLQATIWTNHLGIANEYALQKTGVDLSRMEMYVAGGQIDRDLMMTYDQDAEIYCAKWASKAKCVILSVRSLFGKRGPAGMEQRSLSIKQEVVKAAMTSGADIVFIADHMKMSKGYTNEPLVFPAERDWYKAMESPNVHIVSTKHPEVTEERLVQNPKNEKEWYQTNHWAFRTMKDRYIAI